MNTAFAGHLRLALLTTAIVSSFCFLPASAAQPAPASPQSGDPGEAPEEEKAEESGDENKKTPEELDAIEPSVGPAAVLGGFNLLAIGGGWRWRRVVR